MLDKLASWDTIDFSSSSDAEITQILKKLNIPLSIDEVKKIQFSLDYLELEKQLYLLRILGN